MNGLYYENLTHEQWDQLFAQMNTKQIEEILMDKNVISILINEDVSKSYPSIASLFERAEQLHASNGSYELFTNGYVAELLDKRLSEQNAYGKWNYEEKKFELLCILPENVKWILGTPKYVDILSKVSNYTATSIGYSASKPAKCGMYVLLSDTKKKLAQDISDLEKTLENLKSSLTGRKVDELADKLINSIDEKKLKLDTINKNMEELTWKEKHEIEMYGKFSHEEWDRLFNQMNESEVKEALLNSAMIVSLINEDVTKNYPSINGLINRANYLGIKDEKYFELFTSGYVAELLNKRLSDEQLEDPMLYERKKVELLNNLPVNVKMEITTPSLLSNTDELLNVNAKLLAQGLANGTITASTGENLDIKEGVSPIELIKSSEPIEYLTMDSYKISSNIDEVKPVVEENQISPETEDLLNESAAILVDGLANGTIIASAEENLDFNEGISPIEQVVPLDNDQTLEFYTMEEQRINKNPNLTVEQKQQMRDELWSKFDKYVEQNPESKKQR